MQFSRDALLEDCHVASVWHKTLDRIVFNKGLTNSSHSGIVSLVGLVDVIIHASHNGETSVAHTI